MKPVSIRWRIICTSIIGFVSFWIIASISVIWIQWRSQTMIYSEQVDYLKNFTASLLQQENYEIIPPEPYNQGKYFLMVVRNNGIIYKYNFEILGISTRALIDPLWYESLNDNWIIYNIDLDDQNDLILGVKRDDIYGEVIRITLMIAGVFIFSGIAVLIGLLWSVSAGMKPVLVLQEDVSNRTKDDLGPLDVNSAPSELKNLILAINDLMKRISDARDAEKRFLDQAAHELKTPLAGISGQLEVLALDLNSETAKTRLEKIRQLVKRSGDLISQLLDNAQSQFTRNEGDVIALDQVLGAEIDKYRGLFPDVEILCRMPEGGGSIDVLELPAQLVISNLIKNACLYSGCPARLFLQLSVHSGGAKLVVSDNGLGLSREAFQLACNPFERLARASGGGTGLGLAIVTDTLKRCGWTMKWLEPTSDMPGLSIEIGFSAFYSDVNTERT